MKIKKIIIKNFRAFDTVEIDFADFNCIIGKNDCGKSTVFAALDWFFNNKDLKYNDVNTNAGHNDVSVEIHFSDVMFSQKYPYKFFDKDFIDYNGHVCITKKVSPNSLDEKTLRPAPPVYSLRTTMFNKRNKLFSFSELEDLMKESIELGINKESWSSKLAELIQCQDTIERRMQFDVTMYKKELCEGLFDYYVKNKYDISYKEEEIQNECWFEWLQEDCPFRLPKFELYTPTTPIKLYLNRLLEYEGVCDYAKIDNIANEISNNKFGFKGEVQFCYANCDFFSGTDIPLNTTEGTEFIPLQNRGDGYQQIIKNVFFRRYAEKPQMLLKDITDIRPNHLQTSVIFAFEEPETHLHPSAQLEMFNTIKSLSTKYQVLTTTHSPYIVKALKENKANIVVLERNADEHKTTVKKLEECVLPYLSMNEINYIAFGEPSIEYHIELFGYIQQKTNTSPTSIDSWLQNKGVKTEYDFSIVDSKSGQLAVNKRTKETLPPEKKTLPYCVRNQIDHPHEKNKRYSDRDVIQQSIEIMRKVITENPDIFPSRR